MDSLVPFVPSYQALLQDGSRNPRGPRFRVSAASSGWPILFANSVVTRSKAHPSQHINSGAFAWHHFNRALCDRRKG